ncbi:MAG TPA: NADH-quinone oxidoreductase subunit C [Candidatus Latescibacteria bacterium]|nr:NADH-quinone oxidoreductase subunit C [Candidatus Latescibacterota bacterium]HCU99759.1 NADH-quinone oxidoreductase subunit C [Dehalococcoidia bacterium]|tara:strand:- start:1713 stop:2237 length:525 start_codon:yes stop_codon:yes gene_type:complete
MTRWWSGEELAAEAERLVPGSVSKISATACIFKAENLVQVLSALRDNPATNFAHLSNLCGVDQWDRFEVVYHLQSLEMNQIACAKVEVQDREEPSVPSVVSIWQGAWIQESETYDLFGIRFEGHPNLQRILLWDGYPGYPLRKDFLSMPGGLQPGLNEFAGTSAKPEPPVRPVE